MTDQEKHWLLFQAQLLHHGARLEVLTRAVTQALSASRQQKPEKVREAILRDTETELNHLVAMLADHDPARATAIRQVLDSLKKREKGPA